MDVYTCCHSRGKIMPLTVRIDDEMSVICRFLSDQFKVHNPEEPSELFSLDRLVEQCLIFGLQQLCQHLIMCDNTEDKADMLELLRAACEPYNTRLANDPTTNSVTVINDGNYIN